MNTKNRVTRTVITFVALAATGIGLTVSGKFMAGAIDQSVLIAIGSAIFGASLAFFLVRMFGLLEK